MKLTDRSRAILAARRERKRMEADGYALAEVCWELHRGGKTDHRLDDVQIAAFDGKSVWYRVKGPNETSPRNHNT